MVTRRCLTAFVTLVAAFGLAAMAVAGAINAPNTDNHRDFVNMRDDGIAIHGYDPVAYFVEGEARRGSTEFRYEKDGVTYLFSSQEHLDLFTANPELYVPEFGGYSVFGMARGKAYTTDPTVFDVIDGRLYLSRNEKVRELWMANPDGYIAQAEAAWRNANGR